ncbi:hypothetical protein BC831DRAFT_513718 [Entophlyctis helioformis]|nr:hypothetical protein BC831DRAFT_513718 [Entophlyctis helioformis]
MDAIRSHGGVHAKGLHRLEEGVFVYEGVGHGFANELRKKGSPEFKQETVNLAWRRVFGFLTEHLKSMERQSTETADAAAAAGDEQVRRLQSQLQSTAEQLVALGRTNMDGKPAEIHAMILKLAGPLTLFVNGLLGDTDALDDETAMELWIDAFKMDWQGDLTLLPDVELSADNGLLLAHSRSMYDRLCKRLPQHTEASRARDDAYFNYSHNPLEPISFDCCRLLLIPMRHGWFDLVDFKYPIALARLAFRFGCLDLLKHLERPYRNSAARAS